MFIQTLTVTALASLLPQAAIAGAESPPPAPRKLTGERTATAITWRWVDGRKFRRDLQNNNEPI